MFAENLKTLRRNAGLTQQQVAEALGIDRSTYSYYENGKTAPDLKKIAKLIRIFNTTYDEMLEGNLIPSEDKNNDIKLNDVSVATIGLERSAKLSKEEQLLLSCFRLLDDEDKKEILITTNKKASDFCINELSSKRKKKERL